MASSKVTGLILFLCLLECFIFGGTIFGWNVLVFTLKADGIYKDACLVTNNSTNTSLDSYIESDNNVECNARSSHFSLSFTIATVLMGVTALPLGWFFDKTGLLATRIFVSVIAIPAYLMLAFVTPETSVMIYPAASMIALVAFTIMVTNYHVANLAGAKTATILALYSGGVSSSGMVFLFVKLAHDGGIDRKACLLFLTSLWVLVFITTILLPRYKVGPHSQAAIVPLELHQGGISGGNISEPYFHPDYNENKVGNVIQIRTISADVATGAIPLPPSVTYAEKNTFMDSALSLTFIMHLYYFSVNHLKVLYFIATFNQWANQVFNNNKSQVSLLTDLFGFANAATFVMAPLVGMLIDRKKKSMDDSGIHGIYRGIADIIPLIITCISQLVLSICVLLAEVWLPMAYISTVVIHITRGFFYASAFTFIGLVFPQAHFGKLLGMTYMTGGLANFLQYALLSWANATRSQIQPNIALLMLAITTFVHPISVLWRHHKIKK